MLKFLKRLFRIGAAETHSAIDKLEEPVKMTEQGIREMKEQMDKSLHALAQLKALSIRSGNEISEYIARSRDYEQKAILLLQKGQRGELAPAEADRLASEALVKKEECSQQLQRATADKEKFDISVAQMEGNIQTLRTNISKWENELRSLKARVKVSTATKELNKQLAGIDPSGTVAMLERMKERVVAEEALAQSYGDIANQSKSIDEEIDKALRNTTPLQASESLKALKAKLGMDAGEKSTE